MTDLPAELHLLVDGYRDILARASAGEIGVDDAYAALAQLSATAADGSRWTISPDFGPDNAVFLRAERPGAPAHAAPPHMFTQGSAAGAAGPGPGPTAGVWSDEPDDLLTPPAPVDDAWADPWDDDPVIPAGGRFDAPNAGFPDDVVIGGPSEGGWDPVVPVRTPEPTPPTPTAAPIGVDTTPSAPGVAGKALAGVGAAAASVTTAARRMPAGRRRTFIIAGACIVVLAVFLLTRDRSDTPPPAAEAPTAACPAPTAEVAGADDEILDLLGCLDAAGGPGIAVIGVSADGNGGAVYEPDRTLTRAQALHTAVRLYSVAGGPSARTSSPVDTSGLPADQAASVQAAVDLGLVTDAGDLDAPATRGQLAVVMYRALSRAGVVADQPGGTAPSDAPDGDPEAAQAVVALRAAGIVDGAATDPFRYSDPALVSDWVRWAGTAAVQLRDPDAATTTTTATAAEPAAGAVPTKERINTVVSAVTSGDLELATGVLTEPGDATRRTEAAAMWGGFDALGLSVAAEGAPADADGKLVQRWVVSGGDTRLAYTVEWVLDGDTWVLTTWPSR